MPDSPRKLGFKVKRLISLGNLGDTVLGPYLVASACTRVSRGTRPCRKIMATFAPGVRDTLTRAILKEFCHRVRDISDSEGVPRTPEGSPGQWPGDTNR